MKDIIICDLDGTLADASHRLHHIKPPNKDWDAFFAACDKDAPIQTTLELVEYFRIGANQNCYPGYEIWIVSGRSDAVREKTEEWLSDQNIWVDKLIMRPAGDRTPDYQLKRKWLLDGTIPKDRVFCVFEDRSSVVEMWRTEGLTCYQVAEGDF